MYAQLGDIQFDGLKSISDLMRSESVDYAEVQRIQSKPALQRTGTALVKYSLRTRFHRSFCDPDAESQRIREYLNEGDELPLVTGAGEILGVFVIASVQQESLVLHTDGTSWEISLQIELIEVPDPQPFVQPAPIARVGAVEFALTTNDLNANRIDVQNVTIARAQSVEAGKRLASVSVFAQIGSNPAAAYAKARQSAVSIRSRAADLAAKKNSLQGLLDSANSLVAAIDAQELTLALDLLSDVQRRLRTDAVEAFKEEATKAAAKL